MALAIVCLIAIACLPGALIFRLPIGDRPRRAALAADERAFWAVFISITITTLAAMGLAVAGAYTFRRVVGIDVGLAAILVLAVRMRLRYSPAPERLSWTVAMPLGLVALGLWLFFPSSEYVMGGKDPGTYMNEGIQIAQRGSIVIHDSVLEAVPEEFRPMFLSIDAGEVEQGLDEGVRFMGFFVQSRSRGEVMGQFPHAFPAWIAIGYGLDGLSGARHAVGVWAILGLLAVFFAAARFTGRGPAFVGTVLLAINVAEVWYSRYPNSEMMQQALLFAGLLGLARVFQDDDRFFAPVAAVLLGVMMFARFDSLILIGSVSAGLLLLVADGKRLGWSFMLLLAAFLAAAAAYFGGPLRAYVAIPLMQIGGTRGVATAVALVIGSGLALRGVRARWPRLIASVRPWVPRLLAAGLIAAALYAYFWRQPVGRLAEHDAYALRVFGWYVGPSGLLAAVAGFAVMAWTRFWKDPVLLAVGTLVSGFFFYKIRIVPEHFWQARRYLPLILPLACVMMAAAAFAPYRARVGRPAASTAAARLRTGALYLAAPLAVLSFIGWTFAAATRPLLHHVEYAGLIPALERLAGGFGDRDLVLIEPRNSSDTHVLAPPLAYIYARNVLLFASPRPDRAQLEQFLIWASGRYDRVLLVADGGFAFASPRIGVTPLRIDRFSIPEYESLRNAFPHRVLYKPFDLYIYELRFSGHGLPPVDIDVGGYDNAWVFRMFTRQVQDEVTYRWLRERSFISLPIEATTRAIVLRAGDGGRPARAGTAEVRVFLDDHPLGTITVKGGFADYRIAIPPEIAREAAGGRASPLVRLVSTTWVPKDVLGGADDRALGVMLDRVRIE
jgi:hypothetical protein